MSYKAPSIRSSVVTGACLVLMAILPTACSSQSRQADESTGTIGKVIYVKPKGVYATIDTHKDIELGRVLLSGSPSDKDAAIKTVLAAPDKYPPVVFYFLSKALMEQGKKDDALFWFFAGQLRGRYDAKRCLDVSARSGIGAMEMQIGPVIYPYLRENISNVRPIVDRVLEWDNTTPYNYDHRWINLHGLKAMSLSDNDKPKDEPLSAPESEWKAIRETNRTQFAEGYHKLIAELENKNKELAAPEAQSKYFDQVGHFNYEYGPGIFVPLRNGKILAMGGRQTKFRQPEKFVQAEDGKNYGYTDGMTEIFDPKTGETKVLTKLPFVFEEDLLLGTQYRATSAIELNDGRIFIVGWFKDLRPESEWSHKGEPGKPETWIQRLPIPNKRNPKENLVTIVV